MATRPNSTSRKPERLGRSPVTGHFILKPVGKPSKAMGASRLDKQSTPKHR